MSQLLLAVKDILKRNPFRFVFSSPYQKADTPANTLLTEKEAYFQKEVQKNKQVFHENIPLDQLEEVVLTLLTDQYRQLHAFDGEKEYRLKITKKGKILTQVIPNRQEAPPPSHNRTKEYLLPEGISIPPLVDMGIFTPEGTVIPSMYDKFRQINRFIESVDDSLARWEKETMTVVDFGCGKSYLTFLLYHYLTYQKGLTTHMIGLDLKKEVIAHCQETAKKYQYQGLSFQLGDVKEFQPERPVDMVVSLHACDTATDYALYHGVQWNAPLIFSVPCCQQELFPQMNSETFSLLTRYGLLKERFAADLTDAIRGNLLTACGYRTQLLEFVDWENTPKNTLIRSIKAPLAEETKEKALQEVYQVTEEFHLEPTLLRLLKPFLHL